MWLKKSRKLSKIMFLLLELKIHGKDYDTSFIIIELLFKTIYGKIEASFEEKIKKIQPWLKPQLKRVIRYVWIKKGWYWKKLWVPEENFKNTSCIELVMANVYFLRFNDYAKKKVVDEEYYKRFGDLLAHIVKRKKWNWKAWKWVWAEYDSEEVLKDSKAMTKLGVGVQLWLLNYFEDTNYRFVEIYSDVFEKDEDETEKRIFTGAEGWLSILFDVAERGVHGNFKEVSKTEVHTVWLYLKTLKIKARENANRG
jgi:hypothetical protein